MGGTPAQDKIGNLTARLERMERLVLALVDGVKMALPHTQGSGSNSNPYVDMQAILDRLATEVKEGG